MDTAEKVDAKAVVLDEMIEDQGVKIKRLEAQLAGVQNRLDQEKRLLVCLQNKRNKFSQEGEETVGD